jgi:dethiobiotin synthetase
VVIGSWPVRPDAVDTSNSAALARLAPLRAVMPAGAGSLDAGAFAAMSARVFDRDWLLSLVG